MLTAKEKGPAEAGHQTALHLLLLLPRQVERELNDSGAGQCTVPKYA